jgi:hypothetical protein
MNARVIIKILFWLSYYRSRGSSLPTPHHTSEQCDQALGLIAASDCYFAATATCASETVPALAKSQTAAADTDA